MKNDAVVLLKEMEKKKEKDHTSIAVKDWPFTCASRSFRFPSSFCNDSSRTLIFSFNFSISSASFPALSMGFTLPYSLNHSQVRNVHHERMLRWINSRPGINVASGRWQLRKDNPLWSLGFWLSDDAVLEAFSENGAARGSSHWNRITF